MTIYTLTDIVKSVRSYCYTNATTNDVLASNGCLASNEKSSNKSDKLFWNRSKKFSSSVKNNGEKSIRIEDIGPPINPKLCTYGRFTSCTIVPQPPPPAPGVLRHSSYFNRNISIGLHAKNNSSAERESGASDTTKSSRTFVATDLGEIKNNIKTLTRRHHSLDFDLFCGPNELKEVDLHQSNYAKYSDLRENSKYKVDTVNICSLVPTSEIGAKEKENNKNDSKNVNVQKKSYASLPPLAVPQIPLSRPRKTLAGQLYKSKKREENSQIQSVSHYIGYEWIEKQQEQQHVEQQEHNKQKRLILDKKKQQEQKKPENQQQAKVESLVCSGIPTLAHQAICSNLTFDPASCNTALEKNSICANSNPASSDRCACVSGCRIDSSKTETLITNVTSTTKNAIKSIHDNTNSITNNRLNCANCDNKQQVIKKNTASQTGDSECLSDHHQHHHDGLDSNNNSGEHLTQHLDCIDITLETTKEHRKKHKNNNNRCKVRTKKRTNFKNNHLSLTNILIRKKNNHLLGDVCELAVSRPNLLTTTNQKENRNNKSELFYGLNSKLNFQFNLNCKEDICELDSIDINISNIDISANHEYKLILKTNRTNNIISNQPLSIIYQNNEKLKAAKNKIDLRNTIVKKTNESGNKVNEINSVIESNLFRNFDNCKSDNIEFDSNKSTEHKTPENKLSVKSEIYPTELAKRSRQLLTDEPNNNHLALDNSIATVGYSKNGLDLSKLNLDEFEIIKTSSECSNDTDSSDVQNKYYDVKEDQSTKPVHLELETKAIGLPTKSVATNDIQIQDQQKFCKRELPYVKRQQYPNRYFSRANNKLMRNTNSVTGAKLQCTQSHIQNPIFKPNNLISRFKNSTSLESCNSQSTVGSCNTITSSSTSSSLIMDFDDTKITTTSLSTTSTNTSPSTLICNDESGWTKSTAETETNNKMVAKHHPEMTTSTPHHNFNKHNHSHPRLGVVVTDPYHNSCAYLSPDRDRDPRYVRISLQKNASGGLGFTIMEKDRRIYVRELVRDPALSDGRIRPGDQIISVNGESMCDKTREQAIAMLRGLNCEIVDLVLRHKFADDNYYYNPNDQPLADESDPDDDDNSHDEHHHHQGDNSLHNSARHTSSESSQRSDSSWSKNDSSLSSSSCVGRRSSRSVERKKQLRVEALLFLREKANLRLQQQQQADKKN